MNGSAYYKEPNACSEEERGEFARLVRQGFDGSDDRLPGRISAAKQLAFHYTTDDRLVAVAALKAPHEQYREDVFKKADARISPSDYLLELGWVFVVPACRGNRIADVLCRRLLESVPESAVFATTRPDNNSMIRVLVTLGFLRIGKPYPRGNEELALHLRPKPRF